MKDSELDDIAGFAARGLYTSILEHLLQDEWPPDMFKETVMAIIEYCIEDWKCEAENSDSKTQVMCRAFLDLREYFDFYSSIHVPYSEQYSEKYG